MEGLRGTAVLLVFAVHFSSLMEPWIHASPVAWVASGLHQVGNIGVDLFFVLSGFLIYGAQVRSPKPFFNFMLRRIQRLYPTFLVVLAAYVLISLALPQESKFPAGTLPGLIYLIQNALLLPGMFAIVPIITVAWSLSYEMFFYLSVPVLVTVLNLRQWDWRFRIGFFLLLMVLWLLIPLPHPRMVMFACGMIVADLLPSVLNRRWLPALDYAAIALAPLVLAAVWLHGLAAPVVVALCVLLTCACLGAFGHRGTLHRIFACAPLRWLGNMSYSYYLLHGLTLKAFFFGFSRLVPPAGDQGILFLLLLPISLAATLASSACLFLLVERPYSILVTVRPTAAANATPSFLRSPP